MAKHFKFYQLMARTKQMERETNQQGVLVSTEKGKQGGRKGEKKGKNGNIPSRMASKTVPQTQDSGVGTQEVAVDVHMEDGGEERTPRKRRKVQRYSDTWESQLTAMTPSPMTHVVRATVGGKGPLLQMPQMAGVLKCAEGSRRELFGEEEEDDDDE